MQTFMRQALIDTKVMLRRTYKGQTGNAQEREQIARATEEQLRGPEEEKQRRRIEDHARFFMKTPRSKWTSQRARIMQAN